MHLLKPILFSLLWLIVTPLASRANDKWVTYKNCQLLPNRANDGDSFHVRANGRECIFRLYFVDTPETDASVPNRVADQAKYFGVTVPQTLQVGLEAERFTRSKLTRPFTVVTRKEDARGRSHLRRYFAFIQMNGEDLAEELVANGLARVYGESAQAPGTPAPAAEKRQLLQLEGRAKSQKLGGWGVGAGRLNTRTAAGPIASRGPAGDSFEAFSIRKLRRRRFRPVGRPGANSISTPRVAHRCKVCQGSVLSSRNASSRPARSRARMNSDASQELDRRSMRRCVLIFVRHTPAAEFALACRRILLFFTPAPSSGESFDFPSFPRLSHDSHGDESFQRAPA